MITKCLNIAANTFIAMIRQPIYAVLLLIGAVLIGCSPLFAMFTLLENIKLVKDMGLSTIMVTGLLLAAFSSTRIISEEIDSKTVLTLMSKPVSRWQFVVGKFLGLVLGVGLAAYLLGIVLLMTIRIGVPEAASSPIDLFALILLVSAVVLTVMLAAGINYFFDRAATSTGVALATLLLSAGLVPLCFLDAKLQLQPVFTTIDTQMVRAMVLICFALGVICAAALAVSTRVGLVPNLGFCASLFFLGLLSDYLFGRFAAERSWAAVLYRVVPNLQVFWVADAVTGGEKIPAAYSLATLGYGLCYIVGFLLIGIGLFQDRELS